MKLVINCGKKVEEKAMDFEEKSLLVNKLLKLAKTSKLSNNQKKIILTIVESLDNVTEIQKRRFILYYQLNTQNKKKSTLSSIGKFYGCNKNAIRASVIRVKSKLKRLNKEIKTIEEIVKKHENSNKK